MNINWVSRYWNSWWNNKAFWEWHKFSQDCFSVHHVGKLSKHWVCTCQRSRRLSTSCLRPRCNSLQLTFLGWVEYNSEKQSLPFKTKNIHHTFLALMQWFLKKSTASLWLLLSIANSGSRWLRAKVRKGLWEDLEKIPSGTLDYRPHISSESWFALKKIKVISQFTFTFVEIITTAPLRLSFLSPQSRKLFITNRIPF